MSCSEFRKGTLFFSLELIQLLYNDFFKQQYITLNATVLGLDRINLKSKVCRTMLAGYATFYYAPV